MRRSVVCVLLAALAACTGSDEPTGPASATASSSTPPSTSSSTAPAAAPSSATIVPPTSADAADQVTPDGFDRVRASVTEPDGTICELCLWLADSSDRRRRGLMFVTDLGVGDGMAFVYPTPHTGTFWMKNTLLPLSIAFFGPDGGFIDAFDMEPCTQDPCPLYPTPDDFGVAIETFRGDLGELGIAPGSRLELTDLPCP